MNLHSSIDLRHSRQQGAVKWTKLCITDKQAPLWSPVMSADSRCVFDVQASVCMINHMQRVRSDGLK